MNPYQLILPLGLLTFTLLLITVLIGTRIIKVKFKYHKLFGILTFISALIHGTLAVYLNYFR
jgi:hypothetical protein